MGEETVALASSATAPPVTRSLFELQGNGWVWEVAFAGTAFQFSPNALSTLLRRVPAPETTISYCGVGRNTSWAEMSIVGPDASGRLNAMSEGPALKFPVQLRKLSTPSVVTFWRRLDESGRSRTPD